MRHRYVRWPHLRVSASPSRKPGYQLGVLGLWSCTALVSHPSCPAMEVPGPPCPILPLHREFLAHFTGQWPDGYHPRWRRRPWWHLLTMLLTLVGGVTASFVLLRSSPVWWPLLVLSWMLTVHGARKAQLVIIHHAVHANLTGHPGYDRAVAEVLSTLLLIQPFASYRR